jgi:hypothetical protein
MRHFIKVEILISDDEMRTSEELQDVVESIEPLAGMKLEAYTIAPVPIVAFGLNLGDKSSG